MHAWWRLDRLAIIDRTIDACGAFLSNTTESPEGRTPRSRHIAARSGVTGVAFIWLYNSVRIGTPMASSPASQSAG
jgi:hypothetical protein